MALAINKDNFEALVAGDQPVVIDFWAEWCGPCRTMSPIVDELAAEYEGKVVIGKCDVEENDDITMKYGVRNIPTIVFLKGGELVEHLRTGVRTCYEVDEQTTYWTLWNNGGQVPYCCPEPQTWTTNAPNAADPAAEGFRAIDPGESWRTTFRLYAK